METVLQFLREVLKGIVREVDAFLFRRNVLENKKTTLRRRKHLGGSDKKIFLTTITITVKVARGSVSALLSF